MSGKLNVLMTPDYTEINPFQTLLARYLKQCNVDVTFSKGYKRVFPIYRFVKQHPECDLLHLHWITPFLKGNNGFVVAFYAVKLTVDLLLTRATGTRIVWTIHNQVSHDTRFAAIEILIRRIVSRLVHGALLHGESLKDLVSQQYRIPERKLTIVNLGNYRDVYPPAIDRAEARKRLTIPAAVRKVFLLQGLLKPYKGVEDLIEAWNQGPDKLNNDLLIIAGKAYDTDYENALKKLIEDKPSIRLIPRYVSDDEITILYSACDVVVLPFRKIMASSSLMVAVSFGRPVIAPRLGACEEMLGDADELLYDPQEGVDGLKGSIDKSFRIDLARLSEKTNRRGDFYSWMDVAQKTRHLYDKTLSAK